MARRITSFRRQNSLPLLIAILGVLSSAQTDWFDEQQSARAIDNLPQCCTVISSAAQQWLEVFHGTAFEFDHYLFYCERKVYFGDENRFGDDECCTVRVVMPDAA